MKNLLLTAFAVLFSLISNPATAQENPQEKDSINYVVLTRKIPQLKPIILAAEELAVQDKGQFGDFQVVVCGKGVQELTNSSTMTSFLEKAEKAGVTINACGFSLKKFEVNQKDLPRQIKVVENGILYNFELQKKGYLSIEL